jgi:hypothetical protein
MLVARLKWLIVPLALGLGAAGGVVASRQFSSKTQGEELHKVYELSKEKNDVEENVVDDSVRETRSLDPVPPGLFDIERLATKDESGPPVVKPGQILIVEVLVSLLTKPAMNSGYVWRTIDASSDSSRSTRRGGHSDGCILAMKPTPGS